MHQPKPLLQKDAVTHGWEPLHPHTSGCLFVSTGGADLTPGLVQQWPGVLFDLLFASPTPVVGS